MTRSFLLFINFLLIISICQSARLKLFTGKSYRGSIVSKDSVLSIHTERGIYQFPESLVESITASRSEWIAVGEYVELREEPSFSSDRVIRVFEGTTVRQTGREKKGFRPMEVHGKRGWIHSQFLVKKFQRPEEINPRVKFMTSRGPIVLELFENEAPNTTKNFIQLSENKFYQGLAFHRVDKDFLVMTGDPEGTGEGGPGYLIKSEVSEYLKNVRGAVGMGDSGKDTAGSQFYMLLSDAPHLDGRYTVFGKVIEGLDVLHMIAVGDEILDLQILQKRNHPYKPEVIPLSP